MREISIFRLGGWVVWAVGRWILLVVIAWQFLAVMPGVGHVSPDEGITTELRSAWLILSLPTNPVAPVTMSFISVFAFTFSVTYPEWKLMDSLCTWTAVW